MYEHLIRRDIKKIYEEAELTDDQAAIFKLLLSGKLNDVGIMRKLSMSNSTYYRRKKVMREKVDRILAENRQINS